MAVKTSLIWVTFCTCVVFCVASPTRRQFIIETTSSEPASVATNEEVWDDTDDFDLDGDEDWLGDASPSSIPLRPEYEDYDDDDYSAKHRENVILDVGEEDDVEHQDAEEDEEVQNGHNAEFLFLPSRDTRLMLQDDDDQSGPIKVRHTGRNSYSEVLDDGSSLEVSKGEKDGVNEQFEFTIDEGDDDKDDFVLEESQMKDNDDTEKFPRLEIHDADDDDEDDISDDDVEDDPVFESPEEDSQIIYGDHVFLY